MCLIRYSSDSAVSCRSAALLPVCISMLHITLRLRCLLFITIAVICQKWYWTGFQRIPLLHLFIWKYFHQQVQVIFDWMLFWWKVIACKSWCLPALDRKVCPAFQRCHRGAFSHVIRLPCPLTPLSDRESFMTAVGDLWMAYLPWTGWGFFVCLFVIIIIRWNDAQ